VGYDPVEYGPARWNPAGHARLVHVDFTAAEVDARYQPEVEVVADVREALELLAPLVAVRPERKPPPPRVSDPHRRSGAYPLLPQRVMADLEAVLAPEDLVISDVGAHKLWVAKAYGARLPNTVIVSNGFAAMGIGLPGAIAAKLAEPGRRVVTVTGDGGFLMNVQELETARRLGLAFVVLVMRDDGYGVIRWKQQRRFGRTAGVDLGNPDLVALAEAFGCRGIRVDSAAGLRPALESALASPVPMLVDCPVDYTENDRLSEL
jgi:acetolactate synthase-1/2/3 large subunit